MCIKVDQRRSWCLGGGCLRLGYDRPLLIPLRVLRYVSRTASAIVNIYIIKFSCRSVVHTNGIDHSSDFVLFRLFNPTLRAAKHYSLLLLFWSQLPAQTSFRSLQYSVPLCRKVSRRGRIKKKNEYEWLLFKWRLFKVVKFICKFY